jgi:ABC-type sugar transport system substrate-binding protein
MRITGVKRRVGAGVFIAATLAIAGALSSSGYARTTNEKPHTGSTTSSALATANAAVKAAEKLGGRNWGLPTVAFKPGVKKIAIISAGQSTPAAAQIAASQEAAANAMGWKASPVWDAKLSTATGSALILQAIAQHYNAIDFDSLDPLAMKAPIDEALAKGIAVACASCMGNGFGGKLITTGSSYAAQGTLMAQWLMASSDGKAKIVSLQDDEFPQVALRDNVMGAYIQKNCGGCTYKEVPFSAADLANPGPPAWTAVLAQNPKGSITAAVASYDALAVPMYKTAEQEGRTEIQINGYDLSTGFAPLMAQGGSTIGGDLAQPLTVMGWASVDELGRKLAHVPLWHAANMPMGLATAKNVSQFPGGTYIPPINFQAAFKKLWMK